MFRADLFSRKSFFLSTLSLFSMKKLSQFPFLEEETKTEVAGFLLNLELSKSWLKNSVRSFMFFFLFDMLNTIFYYDLCYIFPWLIALYL